MPQFEHSSAAADFLSAGAVIQGSSTE